MRVLVTGADGFLGWHLRVRARAQGRHTTVPVGRAGWSDLAARLADVDAVIHVAGVNRGPAAQVSEENVALAEQLGVALRSAHHPVRHVVFANSVQAGNGSPYGTGKERAAERLAAAAADVGATFTDCLLPNLFGEHGRPHYNSFVATFAEAVLRGAPPAVEDRPLMLLHVQDAAAALLAALDQPATTSPGPAGQPTSVAEVLAILRRLHDEDVTTNLPELPDALTADLFNTLRAAAFPEGWPRPLALRTDHRGSLVEVVRQHGGAGQAFVSTTVPGATRGEHFHLRKVERFAVLAGSARIELRRVLHDDVVTLDVDGSRPCVVDMPTLWAHNITNTGDTPLSTMFWTNQLFDPEHPDTYPEPVRLADRTLEPAR